MVDWERQRAFLAVLAGGSLSAASRALRIAQPTVRRRIAELEHRHGVVLFTRSPAGLIPTPIAHELGAHAKAMALAADAFARMASGEASAATGVVRITASDVIGVEVLPAILARLQAAQPGLVVELSLNDRAEDMLGREADIAVRMMRPSQDALVAKRVGAVRLGLHAHRHYLDAHGVPSNLDDLRGLALIGFETETIGVRALRRRGLAFAREDFAFRTDSDLGQLAAIRAKIGIGVCQTGIAARDLDLVRLLADAFAFDLDVWVVMHEDVRTVRRMRLAYDALVAGLAVYARLP